MSSNPPIDPDASAVLQQLKMIDRSALFKNVTAQKRLLTFLVNEKLAGHTDHLTGPDIAKALFRGKRNAMRAEIFRLRDRLEEYYSKGGGSDPVHITIPSGAYVPKFSWRFSPGHLDGRPALPTQKQDDPVPPPPEANVRSIWVTVFAEIGKAAYESRWEDVLKETEKGALTRWDELRLPDSLRQHLPNLRVARLLALFRLKRFDQFQTEVRGIDFRDSFPGRLYPTALKITLPVLAQAGDTKSANEIRAKLWDSVAVEDPELCLHAATEAVHAGLFLFEAELYEAAATLLCGLSARIRQKADRRVQAVHAQARYIILCCSLRRERFAEVLELYRGIEEEFFGYVDEYNAGHLAWAGTEATRALRHLNRHSEADALASSLKERFGALTGTSTQDAVAWALVERFETCSSAGDFDGSADLCSRFINEWTSSGRQPELDEPVLIAYTNRAEHLRKAKRYDEALAACDDLIAQFEENTKIECQFRVAWALLEKAINLRRSRRLAASIAATKAVAARFANATDERILGELTWAIRAEGDALLCEGKLFLQNGMTDDAATKLQEACRRFSEAAEKDPDTPTHLKCRLYAEFLLGQREDAEATFAKALSIENTVWLDGFNVEEWPDLGMFPIPADSEFLEAVERWKASRTKDGSQND